MKVDLDALEATAKNYARSAMKSLKLTRETLRIIAAGQVEMSRGPKQITWQCHVPQPKPSFACQIRGPR